MERGTRSGGRAAGKGPKAAATMAIALLLAVPFLPLLWSEADGGGAGRYAGEPASKDFQALPSWAPDGLRRLEGAAGSALRRILVDLGFLKDRDEGRAPSTEKK